MLGSQKILSIEIYHYQILATVKYMYFSSPLSSDLWLLLLFIVPAVTVSVCKMLTHNSQFKFLRFCTIWCSLTSSRLITEVKQHWAWLVHVLGWVTVWALEPSMGRCTMTRMITQMVVPSQYNQKRVPRCDVKINQSISQSINQSINQLKAIIFNFVGLNYQANQCISFKCFNVELIPTFLINILVLLYFSRWTL